MRWSSVVGRIVFCVLVALGAGGGCQRLPGAEAAVQEVAPEPTLAAAVHHPAVAPELDVRWVSPVSATVPMQLTASDGTGLALVAVTGSVVVADPVALTELRLVFDNPEDRRREGRFSLELPPGASLSRLAMRVGDRWMEGEVVERSRGQRTYERYIHRRPNVDPVLMETAGGNRVGARVFPIEPNQRKEIIVSYSQALSEGPFRLPLAGLPELETLDIRVMTRAAADEPAATAGIGRVSSQRVIDVVEHGRAPTEDLVVALDGAPPAAAAIAGELVVARWRPPVRPEVETIDGVTILFDTSASAAAGWSDELDRLHDTIAALGDTPLRIVAYDQTRALVYDGAAKDFSAETLAELAERRAFGASDLAAALQDPLVRDAGHPRLVLWGDGVVTAGVDDAGALAELAGQLRRDGVVRIDAVVGGGSADRAMLSSLVVAGERAGIVVGARTTGGAVADRLRAAGYDDVELTVDGAKWSWPRSLAGHVPGEDVVVTAIYETPPTEVRLELSDPSIGAQVITPREAARPLVSRAVAQARIADLQSDLDQLGPTDVDARQRLQDGITELSIRHRVLTDATAMLVLESEAEYRRYGIERNALADILTIGPGGIELLPRGTGPTGRPLADVDALIAAGPRHAGDSGGAFAFGSDDEDVWGGVDEATVARNAGILGLQGTEVGDASGFGGLGLSGVGRGGGGTGEGTIGLGNLGVVGKGAGGGSGTGTGHGYGAGFGIGFGSRGKAVPRVRSAKADVRGALDKEIVRRIVRAHTNEVRYCYQRELAKNPTAAGRVALQFQIGPTGLVPAATAGKVSAGLDDVGACVAKAARRWKFPSPKSGGTVAVLFPFDFSPDGAGVTSRGWGPTRTRAVRGWSRRPAKSRRRDVDPHEGRYADVARQLQVGQSDAALAVAWEWAAAEPGDVLALVALSEALHAKGRDGLAARVVGSLVDLHPRQAELRRAAGERLALYGDATLAIDAYEKAVALRPDHPSGYRLLAYAYAQQQRHREAFETVERALARRYPDGRFEGVRQLLRNDARILAAAWLANADDADRPAIAAQLDEAGVSPATQPSMMLVATWQTDATDLDVKGVGRDRRHGHRIADVQTGLGPEAWVTRGSKIPDTLQVRVQYYERGAMGAAIGIVHGVRHDGRGGLTFDTEPFVVQTRRGALTLRPMFGASRA